MNDVTEDVTNAFYEKWRLLYLKVCRKTSPIHMFTLNSPQALYPALRNRINNHEPLQEARKMPFSSLGVVVKGFLYNT